MIGPPGVYRCRQSARHQQPRAAACHGLVLNSRGGSDWRSDCPEKGSQPAAFKGVGPDLRRRDTGQVHMRINLPALPARRRIHSTSGTCRKQSSRLEDLPKAKERLCQGGETCASILPKGLYLPQQCILCAALLGPLATSTTLARTAHSHALCFGQYSNKVSQCEEAARFQTVPCQGRMPGWSAEASTACSFRRVLTPA